MHYTFRAMHQDLAEYENPFTHPKLQVRVSLTAASLPKS